MFYDPSSLEIHFFLLYNDIKLVIYLFIFFFKYSVELHRERRDGAKLVKKIPTHIDETPKAYMYFIILYIT